MLRFLRKFSRAINGQNGFILPLVMSYALVFTVAAAAFADYATGTSRQITAEKNHIRTFYAAEAAATKSAAAVRLFLATNGTLPTTAQLTAIRNAAAKFSNKFNINDTSGNSTLTINDSGVWGNQVLTAGNYAGLNGSTRAITINVTTRNTEGFSNANSVTMQQVLQVQLIPLFQFGAFYQNDLEILPGATMTFTGPVHSNKDIYLGSDGSTLNFDSTMTAYGKIFHGRKDSSTPVTGDVWIENASNVAQNMKNTDGTWLDSNSSNWITESQTRWGGEVKSSVHNTLQLNLPLPTSTNSHTLIERRLSGDSAAVQTQKMDYKANIRIIDGQVMTQSGAAIDLRYCSGGGSIDTKGTSSQTDDRCSGNVLPVNPISTTTFFNNRENKLIQSTDIDISKLNASPSFQSIAGSTTGVIIYHSDHTNQSSASREDALRLVNGSTLYKPMTVISENPLYVKGDYNSVNKKAAGVISDAFNILSNSWNDANSGQALSNRVASNTTVQTAVISGNTETTSGHYNGGFENIHRFLESWSGKTLTYKGSVIVLYNSQIATGAWVYGGNQYDAPSRNWSFDTNMADPSYTIPGFPSVYDLVSQRWSVT